MDPKPAGDLSSFSRFTEIIESALKYVLLAQICSSFFNTPPPPNSSSNACLLSCYYHLP